MFKLGADIPDKVHFTSPKILSIFIHALVLQVRFTLGLPVTLAHGSLQPVQAAKCAPGGFDPQSIEISKPGSQSGRLCCGCGQSETLIAETGV